MAQIQERIPAGFEIFSLFARLADKDSKVLAHQDAPGFAWRYVLRFSTTPTATSVDFHLRGGNDPEVFQHVTIPINHGYLASRAVLSRHGVGLYHSVTPTIAENSQVLQISLIFDVRKACKVAAPVKLLQEIPQGSETMLLGGKLNYLVVPARRISAKASARGKMGDKAKKAAGGRIGGRIGDKAKKAAGVQDGRQGQKGCWW